MRYTFGYATMRLTANYVMVRTICSYVTQNVRVCSLGIRFGMGVRFGYAAYVWVCDYMRLMVTDGDYVVVRTSALTLRRTFGYAVWEYMWVGGSAWVCGSGMRHTFGYATDGN
jgi:hypothetical protein